MTGYLAYLWGVICLLFTINCSEDNLTYFQKNNPEPEFRLFDILDDYPALRSAFDPIDQRRFNRLLGNSINNNLKETKGILSVIDDLFLDDDHPLIDSIAYLRNVLQRIINQDEIDLDPLSINTDLSRNNVGFANYFYNLYDMISESDIAISEDIIHIAQKLLCYINDTYTGNELEDVMADLIAYLRDYDDGANEETELEVLGKLLFRANEYKWLDDKDNLISGRGDVEEKGVKNLGIGNSARGIETLLSGLNGLLNDDSNRDVLYDILREIGDVMTATAQGKPLKDVFRELTANLQSHLTRSGSVYKSNETYNRNDDVIFSDAEIGNIQKDFLPYAIRLLMRADREDSFLHDKTGKKIYLLDALINNLRSINFNPDDQESCASHLEESLYDLIRFDTYGRDRVNDPEAWSASHFESLLFLVQVAIHLGWDDGGTTGEVIGLDPNADHGHGKYVSGLTLNDALFSLKTSRILGLLNLYEMAFHDFNGDHVFRSMRRFTADDKDKFKFYFDQNFLALGFVSGFCAADFGIPGGGNPDGGDGEKLNNYMPYNSNGIGDSDTARFLLSLVIRACWDGEGPYYSTETMDVDGNVYTYYRPGPDKKINLRILKKGEDPDQWFYSYPANGDDPVDRELSEEYMKELNNFPEPYRSEPQRENRYRAEWNTDYYMVSYTPLFGSEKICIPGDMSGDALEAECYHFQELIPEKTTDRECRNHEETIYRNWQYVMTEKKISLGIPLYGMVDLAALFEAMDAILGISVDLPKGLNPGIIGIPIFLTVEANGVSGLTSLRKVSSATFLSGNGNGAWMKMRDPDDPDKFWYGESRITGDNRLKLDLAEELISGPTGNLLDLLLAASGQESLAELIKNIVFDTVLGEGQVLPPHVCNNAPQLYRLIFPRSRDIPAYGSTGGNPLSNEGDYQLGSRKGALREDPAWGFEANDSDSNWRNRNALVCLLIPLFAALRDHALYDEASLNPLTPAACVVKNPLKALLDGVFSYLTSPPMSYYQKDHADSLFPRSSWMQIVKGGSLNSNAYGEEYEGYILTRSCDIEGRDPYSPFDGWAVREFYRPAENKNLLNMVCDSDPFAEEQKRCDGILSLLLEYDISKDTTDPDNKTGTRLISGIIKLLYSLGSHDYGDSEGTVYDENFDKNSSGWGVRRKILYGLEQIFTTLKIPKGEITKLYENDAKRARHPDWLFTDYGFRPEDINVEDDPVAGLATFSDDINWDNYNKFMDSLGALLSSQGPEGSKYNIMEELIDILNKIFTKIDLSDKDIRGLRHTLGSVFTRYNRGEWEYPDEIVHLLEKEAPNILEVFQGQYSNLLILADALIRENGNDEGFLLYFLKNFKSAYPTQDVFEQLFDFLGIDLIARSDSALWNDMADIITDFVEMINEEEQPGWFQDDTFLSNRGMDSADPYNTLGELLSW